MTEPLTVDDALKGLTTLGTPADETGTARCPRIGCGGTLTVSQNGVGARLTCDRGCDEGETRGILRNAADQATAGFGDKAGARLYLATMVPEFKVPVESVTKWGNGRAYDIHLTSGETVHIEGGTKNLLNFAHCQAQFVAEANVLLEMPAKTWRKVAGALNRIADSKDGLTTDEAETVDWILGFARFAKHVDLDSSSSRYQAIKNGPGIMRDHAGRLYVHLSSLLSHIRQEYGHVVTRGELSTRLGRLGFSDPIDLSGKQHGQTVHREFRGAPQHLEDGGGS
jgi:hypothetical protein